VWELWVNDLVRDKIRENNDNELPLAGEILAGGCVSKIYNIRKVLPRNTLLQQYNNVYCFNLSKFINTRRGSHR